MTALGGQQPNETRLGGAEGWPPLPYEEWEDTCATLHRWLQIVGNTRLALAPMTNHWWQATFYVTARGLSTSPVPHGDRVFEAEFDFADQVLVLRSSDGDSGRLALAPRTVADFHRDYRAMLERMGLPARMLPRPVEVEDATPFADDRVHASYDGDAARRWWRSLVQADRLLKSFRGRFIGKASPVHLFWGGMDLACTRFSGRTAPPHPGGIPNVGDHVMHEAYSHECISAGWWAGSAALREPAFYSYAYPEPDGFAHAGVLPSQAYYHPDMRLFVLPHDAVRASKDPDGMVLAFLHSVYERGADLAVWDRAALERPPVPG